MEEDYFLCVDYNFWSSLFLLHHECLLWWLCLQVKDLTIEFPDIKGFSHTNLKYIRRWYQFYNLKIGQQALAQLQISKLKQLDVKEDEIIQQPVGQIGQQAVDQIPGFLISIPWGHHLQIITKCKQVDEALFYLMKQVLTAGAAMY